MTNCQSSLGFDTPSFLLKNGQLTMFWNDTELTLSPQSAGGSHSLKATIRENTDSGWLKEVIKLIVKTFHAGKVSIFATS